MYPYNPDYDIAHIIIQIVNCGRRPAILTLLGGDLMNNSWMGTYLGKDGKGLRLEENEKYETSIYLADIYSISSEGYECAYINFWFEDTIGKRYIVKNSEALIARLKESNKS